VAENIQVTGETSRPRSRFTRGLEILCALMLGVMVVLLFIQVFSRYALSDPPDWTEELARAVFIYLTFVGGALAIVRNAHLKIQTLHERLSPTARASLDVALTLVGAIFLAVVVFHSFTLLRQLAHQPMTSVPVSKAFVFAAVPVGCSLMLVYELMRLVALVRSLKDR
jgi:TRAP-type C4-dicarboxylate transport system permease small subunit